MSEPPNNEQSPSPVRSVIGQVFSLGETAEFLQLSKPTVKHHLKTGKMKYTQNEQGHYQIPKAEVLQFKRNREEDNPVSTPVVLPVKDYVSERVNTVQEQGGTITLEHHREVVKGLQGNIADLRKAVDGNQEREILLLTDQSERAGEMQNRTWKSKTSKWLYYLFVLLGFVFLGLFLWGNSAAIDRAVVTFFEQL